MLRIMNRWIFAGKLVVYIFALIGFFLTLGYFAVKLGFTNTPGVVDEQTNSFLAEGQATTTPNWVNDEEWQVFKAAVTKDQSDILSASALSHVPARLIVGLLATEQLRLFYTDRELFKAVFAPLKILGDQSQFSWGVMGIKETTAEEIEENLTSTTSPFYLGEDSEHLLDFDTSDHDNERFARITDPNSRFYSYLYAGLYIAEIEAQWKKAGFDISNRPDILGTLFNIGFEHSHPNPNPQSGGALIDIDGEALSFGQIVAEFYYSDELTTEFSR